MPPEAFVSLRVPGLPEYLLVVRLMVSGVATRMNFPAEAVEDIKLAVSEACTFLLERRRSSAQEVPPLEVRCHLQEQALAIEVEMESLPSPSGSPAAEALEPAGLGMLIMQCIMDEVEILETASSLRLRMMKRLPLTE